MVAMQPRRSRKTQKRRYRARYHGFRTVVEWLTITFVIICLVWMVVVLIMYEWHAVHTRAK